MACMRLLLATPGLELNAVSSTGGAITPFFMAVQQNRHAVVELLAGTPSVDTTKANNEGLTPLAMAAKKGYDAILQTLLQVPEVLAAINQPDREGKTALYHACRGGKRESSMALLFSGADINRRDNAGQLPLEVTQDEEIQEMLLQAGAGEGQQDLFT